MFLLLLLLLLPLLLFLARRGRGSCGARRGDGLAWCLGGRCWGVLCAWPFFVRRGGSEELAGAPKSAARAAFLGGGWWNGDATDGEAVALCVVRWRDREEGLAWRECLCCGYGLVGFSCFANGGCFARKLAKSVQHCWVKV